MRLGRVDGVFPGAQQVGAGEASIGEEDSPGSRTSVLSPRRQPSGVISRLDPEKIVSRKLWNFLAALKPKGSNTDGFVPGRNE